MYFRDSTSRSQSREKSTSKSNRESTSEDRKLEKEKRESKSRDRTSGSGKEKDRHERDRSKEKMGPPQSTGHHRRSVEPSEERGNYMMIFLTASLSLIIGEGKKKGSGMNYVIN